MRCAYCNKDPGFPMGYYDCCGYHFCSNDCYRGHLRHDTSRGIRVTHWVHPEAEKTDEVQGMQITE